MESQEQLAKVVSKKKMEEKIMVLVSWRASGILLLEWLKPGKSINGEAYQAQIDNLMVVLRQNHREMLQGKVVYHHNNARPYTANESVKKTLDQGFTFINHPPYSLDLAPSDLFLFSELKCHIRGTFFQTQIAPR